MSPTGRNTRGAQFGFPVGALARNRELLLAAGHAVVVIEQTDEQYTRIRQRVPAYRVEPIPR